MSQRAIRQLHAHGKTLELSTPKVMGILNVTPDSFSDGGRYHGVDRAMAHVESMIADGVHIIDIGGESTRPNAATVSTDEELRRVVPVVQAIRQHFGDEIWLSVDTSNPQVMQAGVESGADIINDVRALRRDGAVQMAASLGVPVVLMHSRGEPDTMNELAVYTDVIREVIDELSHSIERAVSAGVAREQLVIDVGMGFAKTYEHHKVLMSQLDTFIEEFDLPMLFGVSRKRFLGEILQRTGLDSLQNHQPHDRDIIGAGMSLLAVQQGASIVRVHDVAKSVQMLSMWQQIYGG